MTTECRCNHENPAPVQRAGAGNRDVKHPQQGLARLRTLQPRHAAGVPHPFSGRPQLRLRGQKGRPDAGDAAWFAKEPLSFEDLVRPGQRVPRAKRVRRRGKKAIAR